MAASVVADFGKVFQQWFESTALPHLADYLTKEKKITTTCEELKTIFNLPSCAPQVVPPFMPFSAAMGLPGGIMTANGAVPNTAPATPKAPGRGRTKAVVTGKFCKYVFGKGAKANEACGKPELGYDYCRACIGKAGPKEELHKLGVTDAQIETLKNSGAVVAGQAGTNVNTIVPTKPASIVAAPTLAAARIPNMSLVAGHDNLYMLTSDVPGALVYKPDPSQDMFVCVGFYKEGSAVNPIPLTPEQKRGIENLGIPCSTPQAASNGQSPPQLPQGNQLPQGAPLFPSQAVAPPLFPSSQPIASPVGSPFMPPNNMQLGGPLSPPQVLLSSVTM